MREPAVNRVAELFGHHPGEDGVDWQGVVRGQGCPLTGGACYKTRKSLPDLAIGSCTVLHGAQRTPVMICPARLLERRLAFSGCIHLLTNHEPGNELHVVPEVEVPGGQVDYFLASVRRERVVDFVGIEFQTLDTTGSVWPERQRLLRDLGVPRADAEETSNTRFGMNWKHTAKTALVQMHHKIATFEHVNRRLVLVLQDTLLAYMRRNFDFGGLHKTALLGDAMHFHGYAVRQRRDGSYRIELDTRVSTDAAGVARCLGLQAEARVGIREINAALEQKIGRETLFPPA